ncbi:glycogen synthase [Patescibacteria group bacterium]
MKVLLAASEVAPIVKIGGLGDVIGSLPKALEIIGINADVIVPFYPVAKVEKLKLIKSLELNIPFDNGNHVVEVIKTKLPDSNVDVLLLKNSEYFSPGGSNAFLNNPSETELFSFFSRAVVEYIKAEFNTYDLIHCHDWHTGLITHILQEELGRDRPATLFTIHNLFYQGKGEVELVKELGFSPGSHPLIDYDIKDGDINLLYQGVTSSDYVSTVSETYAEEIKTKEFGDEMAEILIARKDKLTGILNGIDYSFFPRDYDIKNWKDKKKKHKDELKKMLKLKDSKKPLFSFVSRLDPGQKGLDILYVSLQHIMQMGGQFVLLGTGDPAWEKKFRDLGNERKFKSNMSINIEFSVDLANKIYSGSDYFFVPSRYEPCGLTQMIAMHYGTPPVVRAVGGLKDTVDDGVNGYVFKKYTSIDLNKAIDSAFKTYEDENEYSSMVEAALNEDFSWTKSAEKYAKLYEDIISSRS